MCNKNMDLDTFLDVCPKGKMYTKYMLCLLMLTICVLSQNVLEYRIEENRSPTVLGNIFNDSNLQLPQNQGISFSILPIPKGYNTLFQVDTYGEFKTAIVINRDSVCPMKITCKINLDVQVNPVAYFQIIKVNVIIDDVNDESPTFEKTIYTFALSESSSIGTSIVLPTANDLDSPTHGVVSYQMGNSSDNGAFQFIPISQLNTEPRIVTLKTLDRETTDKYQFLLFAMDSANPAHKGSTLIIINLLDVNDSPPTFSKSVYEITVDENKAINESILQVSATDKDTGTNAQVYYYLSTVSMATYGSLFTIDEMKGTLRINDVLDYEKIKEATLTIVARNGEITSPSSQAKVIVHVRDLNDQAPSIKVQTSSQGGRLTIEENANLGTFVAHITVQDTDSGIGGQFNCNLTKPTTGGFSLVKIHTTDFKIITNMLFDREKQADYEITIVCIDKGPNSLSSTQNIAITISDVNDNTPQFENSTYKVVITENDTPGQILLTVKAHDKDMGNNGSIRYTLCCVVSNAPNSYTSLQHLKINPLKGEISIVKAFDYELTKALSFNVIASDHGQPSRTSQCTVFINVIDRDDEGPVFRKSVYEMKVFENNKLGTSIGQVAASDNDSNIYNVITYWFMSQTQNNKKVLTETDGDFIINHETGTINVNASLDREIVPNYTMHIVAQGMGPAMHNSTCIVQVLVIDQNDNTPQIIFPNSANHTISVPNILNENDILSKVEAVDLDENENSLLTFHIVSGDDNGLLQIDENTGNVIASRDYTAPLGHKASILILVTDNGIPRRSNSSYLRIEFNLNPITGEIEIASSKNSNIVIGIGVFSGIIVVVLIIAILCLLRHKTRGQSRKHEQLKTVSQSIPYDQVIVNRSNHTQSSPDEYQLGNGGKANSATKKIESIPPEILNVQHGFDNQALDLCDLDGPVLQKLNAQELPPYDERHLPDAGVASKDSASEGSNTDSGRGSHEETTSLPGLQRWDNMCLSTESPEKSKDNFNKAMQLTEPHADPEGRRVQTSQSFRSDTTVPPELPPRNRRLSQSFRTTSDNYDAAPPPPPPRRNNRTSQMHFDYPHSQSTSFREFDDSFYQVHNTHNSIGNTDFLYDSPKVLHPHSMPNLFQDAHLHQVLQPPLHHHNHVGNDEFVDFIDSSYPGVPGAMYVNPRKMGSHNGSFQYNPYVPGDDVLLLDNDDVFTRDVRMKDMLPPITSKYYSDV